MSSNVAFVVWRPAGEGDVQFHGVLRTETAATADVVALASKSGPGWQASKVRLVGDWQPFDLEQMLNEEFERLGQVKRA